MSKNFELMQEALRETLRETTSPPQPATVVLIGAEADRNQRNVASEFDAVAQQECLKLVQRLFLGQTANPLRVVAFAGVDRGNGCSRICIETALTLAANTSASVCLVDGNFRTPSLAGYLGVPADRGLADALLTEDNVRSFARQLKPSNLWLLPAGSVGPQSPSLLNSERLKLRLQQLRQEFDHLLIDTPALNLYSDTIALGRNSDGVLVVVEADSTRRESALQGIQSLRGAEVQVLGAVLNRRTFPIPEFFYRRL